MSAAILLNQWPAHAPRRVLGVAWGLSLSCALAWCTPVVTAAAPDVQFDAPLVVSCRDVTTDESAAVDPQHRLVEARFEMSVLPGAEAAPDALQYVYRFASPHGTLQVVDYAPRTSQATQLAGNVEVQQTEESSKSLAAALSGGWAPFAQGSAHADLSEKRTAQMRYELKPPTEVQLVAGTMQRGTGVYFKLLPAADRASEGAHEFVIVMRVARAWRGDFIYVACEAQAAQEGRIVSRGVSRFVMGLHLAGDEEVRVAAEQMNRAEFALRRAVVKRQRDIARRATPTVMHRVGALLDMVDPRIPDQWLDRLVYGPASMQEYAFVDYLPDDVRRLADGYVQAKRRMGAYNGLHRTARHEGVAVALTRPQEVK